MSASRPLPSIPAGRTSIWLLRFGFRPSSVTLEGWIQRLADGGKLLARKVRPTSPAGYGVAVACRRGRRLTFTPMNARDRLLIFVALEGAPQGLDPVRLQKGMFLFSQDPIATEAEKYQFVPYNYGPMSAQIYADLETLAEQGLVEVVPVSGQSWARYIATAEGLSRAQKLLNQETSPAAAHRLHAIKKDVASKTFSAVLEDVYDRYPEFATNSVFRRAT